MFKKQKQSHTENIIELQGYAPYSGITPQNYVIPECLHKFEDKLDSTITTFLSEANPDEFNGDFLDAIIQCIEDEAISGLYSQKATHEKAVIGLMKGQFDGDIKRCMTKIEYCKEELEQTERALTVLNQSFERYNKPKQSINN